MDNILDSLIDTLKIMPYLLVTFIILELLEHKLSSHNESVLIKSKKYGPVVGGVLGALPQCGFSAVAANLFSNKVITIGTVVAVFLSTSDEMLPIMISEQTDITLILKIIGFKVLIGILTGIVIDIIFKKKKESPSTIINHMCNQEHCDCESDGIILSSIKHTIKISLFIFIANIFIGMIINLVGENNLSNMLKNKNIFSYFISSLIGLVPNCASSVIITKLYLANLITPGLLLSSLLTGSGIGLLLLFKTNKDNKENILILSVIYIVGVIIGMLVDIIL